MHTMDARACMYRGYINFLAVSDIWYIKPAGQNICADARFPGTGFPYLGSYTSCFPGFSFYLVYHLIITFLHSFPHHDYHFLTHEPSSLCLNKIVSLHNSFNLGHGNTRNWWYRFRSREMKIQLHGSMWLAWYSVWIDIKESKKFRNTAHIRTKKED